MRTTAPEIAPPGNPTPSTPSLNPNRNPSLPPTHETNADSLTLAVTDTVTGTVADKVTGTVIDTERAAGSGSARRGTGSPDRNLTGEGRSVGGTGIAGIAGETSSTSLAALTEPASLAGLAEPTSLAGLAEPRALGAGDSGWLLRPLDGGQAREVRYGEVLGDARTGRLAEDSLLLGPGLATGGRWRMPSEVPGLARWFGRCHHCSARLEERESPVDDGRTPVAGTSNFAPLTNGKLRDETPAGWAARRGSVGRSGTAPASPRTDPPAWCPSCGGKLDEHPVPRPGDVPGRDIGLAEDSVSGLASIVQQERRRLIRLQADTYERERSLSLARRLSVARRKLPPVAVLAGAALAGMFAAAALLWALPARPGDQPAGKEPPASVRGNKPSDPDEKPGKSGDTGKGANRVRPAEAPDEDAPSRKDDQDGAPPAGTRANDD